jgi:predicted AAA+ superfamily ATPase
MILRPLYTDKLSFYRDKDLIKVLVGLRRSGKSTLLSLYKEQLLSQGVSEEQVIEINFENPLHDYLRNSKVLYEYVIERKAKSGKTYVFLDEIPMVEGFEHAVDGLYLDKSIDIYITGSNAYFLSGELATLLSGRYVEIVVLPLSFKEYVFAQSADSSRTDLFQNYLRFGGIPYTLAMENNPEALFAYLGGVYNTVVRKDVVTRLGIANPVALDEVTKFLFDNIGNSTSKKKISDTLTSAGMKISLPTVSKYVQALVEAFVFYKADRYDLKGKRYLQTQEKYYTSDLGLRYYLCGDKPGDLGHTLENVVYLELLRRNYQVAIGKSHASEIDFVVTGNVGVAYYQVSATVFSDDTLERELAPLRSIKDNYPKFLLTLDEIGMGSHEGIQQINLIDWLLNQP